MIRVAGNVVAPSIIGSIEFAASTFGTQLVVVMGHSKCGAVAAALDSQLSGQQVPSENIRDIVDRISPSIQPVITQSGPGDLQDREKLLNLCIRGNVEASIRHLQEGSQIIRSLIQQGKLHIVGAEYCLASGEVSFLQRKGAQEINDFLRKESAPLRSKVNNVQEVLNVF